MVTESYAISGRLNKKKKREQELGKLVKWKTPFKRRNSLKKMREGGVSKKNSRYIKEKRYTCEKLGYLCLIFESRYSGTNRKKRLIPHDQYTFWHVQD